MASAEVTLERSMFVGIIFASLLYGIDVTLYFLSCHLLLRKQPHAVKGRKFYIIYSSFMIFLLTITVVTNYALGDLMWIDDRNVPGGPPAYYADNISAWYNTFGTAADVTANAMADGLLLYRCFVFWSDHRWVVIFPALLYVSSVSMAIMMTIESALPGANIFKGMPTNFLIPWLVLTVSFNIIVTLAIIGRLLVTYWQIRKTLGRSFSGTYINISATLMESALPFSVLGLGFLISQVLNSGVVIAFSFVWGTFAGLAPQFIIYRVAMGIAWSKDSTFKTTASVQFTSSPNYGSNSGRSTGQLSAAGGTTLAGFSNTDLQFCKEEKVEMCR